VVPRLWYRIRAENQVGTSDYSNTVDVFTPIPASQLGVINVTSSQVDLRWTQVGNNGYALERSTDGGPFEVIFTTSDPATLTFSDTTVSRPHTYVYRVRAFNTNPDSESVSNTASAVVGPIDIEFPFPDGIQNTNGLQLNGSALFSADEHILRLHNDFSQAGSVFTTNKVSASQWNTTFWIRLHEGTQPNPADGLTFTIQANSPTALGAGGGALGYQGIPRSVAIKF